MNGELILRTAIEIFACLLIVWGLFREEKLIRLEEKWIRKMIFKYKTAQLKRLAKAVPGAGVPYGLR